MQHNPYDFDADWAQQQAGPELDPDVLQRAVERTPVVNNGDFEQTTPPDYYGIEHTASTVGAELTGVEAFYVQTPENADPEPLASTGHAEAIDPHAVERLHAEYVTGVAELIEQLREDSLGQDNDPNDITLAA